MTGEYVTSVHSRIEKYTRQATAESRAAAATAAATDPAAYLRRIQTLRERTHRWDSDRLRSGARRIAGVSYTDSLPVPDPGSPSGHVSLQLEMRRYRDAEIARRRQPPPPPRLGAVRGQRIVDLPVSHSREEPHVQSPDLDILRRLLRTPSRILDRSADPLTRLGSGPEGKSPVNGFSAASTPGARLPPVRGRLLPISMSRSLRSAHRQRLEETLKTTRLPCVDGDRNRRSQTSNGQSRPDLHGFRIYQHLMGHETHRRQVSSSVNAVVGVETGEQSSPPTTERHPLLPLPSFPITQLLSRPEAATRVDYISINVAIPRAESRPDTPPPPKPPSRPNSEGTFVPPPSPAYPVCEGGERDGQWARLPEEDE